MKSILSVLLAAPSFSRCRGWGGSNQDDETSIITSQARMLSLPLSLSLLLPHFCDSDKSNVWYLPQTTTTTTTTTQCVFGIIVARFGIGTVTCMHIHTHTQSVQVDIQTPVSKLRLLIQKRRQPSLNLIQTMAATHPLKAHKHQCVQQQVRLQPGLFSSSSSSSLFPSTKQLYHI